MNVLRKAAVAFLYLFFCQDAVAQYMMPVSEIKDLPVIEVVLDDQAKNACWTNLSESRQYAEEKLRSVGATVYDGRDKFYGDYYTLRIRVFSKRSAYGQCIGLYEIDLLTGAVINDKFHFASPRSVSGYFMKNDNVNQGLIEAIQSYFTDTN